MNARLVRSIAAVAFAGGIATFAGGCAREVSHTESDKPGWFGGHKHEETTVYKNADGTTSVEKSVSKHD